MLQFLFTIACLVSCVLCNTYRRPSYGTTNDGGVGNTDRGDDVTRLSGGGSKVGFSGVESDRRGGALFDGLVTDRREGAVFDGLVSGRRGGDMLDGLVSRQKTVFGGQRRGIGFGFDDFVSGRGVESDVRGRLSGGDGGPRGNGNIVTGRVERRWEQGRSRWADRRDDRWRESRRGQTDVEARPNTPVKYYN